MSIVSHELVSSEPNGDRINVIYKFTDHLGEEYIVDKLVSIGTDTNADMLAMIPGLEESLARSEIESAVASVEREVGIDAVAKHQTQPDFDRRVLGYGMMIYDLVHMWNLYASFWTDFESRSGNNKPQRAAYLGVDTATYDLIDKRYNDMAGITALITDEKGRVWESLPDGYY